MSKTVKAYITGICGFAGSHLARELTDCGYRIRGAALPGESDRFISDISPKIAVDRFNILNPEDCRKALVKYHPDFVFHLAAIASVGLSFSIATETFNINVNGTKNILDAAKNKKWLKRLVFVSSSDIYGSVNPKNLPIKPNTPLNPISPYAQSKVAAEYLVQMYREEFNVPVSVARPFNHTGPGQNPNFVIPSFCRKIVAAEKSNGRKSVGVGNLNARRDISDVRDIVRGYRLIAEKGDDGEIYHLCSGKAFKVGDLLKKLTSFSDIMIRTQKDKNLFRKIDIPVLRGSYYTTRKQLGWKPDISIDQTLRDSLEYWRMQCL